MQYYSIYTDKGALSVQVMHPATFDGEYDRRSLAYVAGTWFVSSVAMITNLTQAFVRKMLNGNSPVSRNLWEMGRDRKHFSSFAVDRFSRFNHQAKYGAAGWRSLDLFYNYHDKIKPQLNGGIESWITRHWIGKFENRQAVTNRLKISIKTLVTSIKSFSKEKEIRLLSIASGSAQAVVKAMKEFPDLNIRVVLIDADASALEEARKLIDDSGMTSRFTFVHDTTKALDRVAEEFKPHIIEMVGFLDYRPRKQAIALIERIRMRLPEGGIFVTCNIRKNREKMFLDWVLLWPMIYRSEHELADVLVRSGFLPSKTKLIYEPFKIHGIAVCRK